MPKSLNPTPPLQYNPQTGVVRSITTLPSGRAILNVGLPNGHEIRAVITSDLLYLNEVPLAGAVVEIMQTDGLWVYVRTVNTNLLGSHLLAGNATVSVVPGSVLLSALPSVVSMTPTSIILESRDNYVEVGRRIELSGSEGGIVIDGKLVFTPGQAGEYPSSLSPPAYEFVVKDPGKPFELQSREVPLTTDPAGNHRHTVPPHLHVTDLDAAPNNERIKHTSQPMVDAGLVESPIPPPPVATPGGLQITDSYDFKKSSRTLSWSPIPGVQYSVRYSHQNYGDAVGVSNALHGVDTPELQNLAGGLVQASFTFDLVAEGPNDRRLIQDDSPPTAPIDQVVSVEVVTFQVRAIARSPLRVSLWSLPKKKYFVNLK